MAGNYSSARTKKVLGPNAFIGGVHVPGSLVVLNTDVTGAGNAVVAFRVPAGFVATGINMTVPDMDTGTTLTISVGDSGSAGRLVSASTVGQAGGSVTSLAASGSYYQFPVDTDILVTFPAASTAIPSSATSATITNFFLEGFVAFP
jgi:hypothetical protein